MALVARHGHMRAGKRKWSVVVIERRIQPRRCRVANGAVGRITQGHVIRHAPADGRRVVEVLRVAPVAIGG